MVQNIKQQEIIMPDEITIKPKGESEFAPITPLPDNPAASAGRIQKANLCALGVGVSFFLPWAHFFGANPSGFDLQKLGDEQRLLWLIPIFCAITIFAGITKRSQKIVGQLTGALPCLVGIYWFRKFGDDLFKMLDYGAYLSLIFGAMVASLTQKAKQPKM
jgi:hypothetical protein